ncbi:MAG: hypothetical protein IT317_19345 [Anaerolineales bacterium]|nr:hypothetical protein [Anaerolineales bacterium]
MADVSAIFGILLALGLVFPGLLTAWWLLFPATVERARLRLEVSPWPCFWLGGVVTAALVIPIVILLALPIGPAKLAGWVLMGGALAVASLGAAGLAAKMAGRLERLGGTASPLGAFVRAAVALELAAAFPIIGWLVVIPFATVTALGATVFALLRWTPRTASAPVVPAAANAV